MTICVSTIGCRIRKASLTKGKKIDQSRSLVCSDFRAMTRFRQRRQKEALLAAAGWFYLRNELPTPNLFTARCGQRQISTKFPNFIFLTFEKQIASCESRGRELSSEWSHHRISSTDSKVRVTLQNSIKNLGSERDKYSQPQCIYSLENNNLLKSVNSLNLRLLPFM